MRTVKAYIDGSFNPENNKYGSGVYILDINDKKMNHKGYNFSGNDIEKTKLRNIAGELNASVFAMKYAKKVNADNLDIHYDYYGIEKLCTGEWKGKTDLTRNYKKAYDDMSKHMDISFHKEKAHTNCDGNNYADILAKKSVNIKGGK